VIGRALREAGWAPLGVLVVAWIMGRTTIAHEMWWLMHVLGGAALGFFFLRAIDRGTKSGLSVAFAFACTGALGWELLEFAIDQLFGTGLQEGQLDTMSDLMLSVCGTAGYLACAALSESRA